MKKIVCFLITITFIISGSSCSKIDNYSGPSSTIKGSVVNANTGEPIQTEIGDGGTRIKLLELSWSDNPTPQYLYSRQDGTYNNNKIFAAIYNVSPEGAFVPLIQTNNDGEVVVDNSKTVEVSEGEVETVNFEVEPFLMVKWVGDPILNTDGTITAKFIVTRGTENPKYQPNMNAVFLFVNNTKYLGNNNWDNRYSYAVTYPGTSGNALLGEVISLTTKGGALPAGRDFYLRVGARTDYGLQLYNYNEPKMVHVPE